MRHISILTIKLTFLLFLLLFISYSDALSDELMGQEIFVADCVGCHTIKAPKEDETITEMLQRPAPPLRYAGSKFKSSFLLSWLQNPLPIRPLAYNSLTQINTAKHIRLTRSSAADVTSYLMTLRLKDTRPIKVEPVKIEPRVTLLAKQIFSHRFSCYSCHRIRGQNGLTGGVSGPSLVEAGTRLKSQWVYTFLTDPRKTGPEGSMPTYAGLIDDDELMELTRYLATFK